MRLLLDTHVLLWLLSGHDRIDKSTREVLSDPANDVLFSAASIWEIAIKSQLGRLDFGYRSEEIAQAARESGLEELPVRSSAASRVASLPMHHRDPFDRLLIAQAIAEPARLYTADGILSAYSELVTLIG
ncbi:MAG: type II toxin-antitoxin system VapC family toxin [Alphaproteobacteria bacterium]|nr:type II toxin-antitoxin system VapC family toxin [Alphaproteobacteria bacterium]